MWPHGSKNTWRYVVSCKIGKTTPSWWKLPWCPAKKIWLTGTSAMLKSIMVICGECGYNIWTTRSHGWKRIGEKAYQKVGDQQGINVTVALAISPTNGLIFHLAFLVQWQDKYFLTQARLNLNPNEHLVFIYDGAPAHYNPAIPGLRLESYHCIACACGAAIEADIHVTHPEQQEQMNNRTEARWQGIALGNFHTQLLRSLRCNCLSADAVKC